MARTRYDWYPIIGLAVAANLLTVLLLGTWVQALNPGLSPVFWFNRLL